MQIIPEPDKGLDIIFFIVEAIFAIGGTIAILVGLIRLAIHRITTYTNLQDIKDKFKAKKLEVKLEASYDDYKAQIRNRGLKQLSAGDAKEIIDGEIDFSNVSNEEKEYSRFD